MSTNTGTQAELDDLRALSRLVRGKARQAYRALDELRTLTARLEDAVTSFDTERTRERDDREPAAA